MIHPTALIGGEPQHRDRPSGIPPQIAKSVRIGAFVTVDCGIKRATTIGARTFVMSSATINHDCVVGPDCEIASGVVLAGHCTIGKGVRIGVNACLRPGITVGDGARIGAGAVIVKDVPADTVVVGNPARPL